MAKMIDQIERWLLGEAPPPPIAQLIGFRLTAIEPGEAIIESVARSRFPTAYRNKSSILKPVAASHARSLLSEHAEVFC
jgi:hypothetical protein